jgi:LuxR family transcriptional regulator of csgAB operon
MLVLWDAPRQDGERFLAGLREIRAKLTAAHLLALFNVEPQAKIEPLAFRCGVRGFFYQHDGWETLAKGIRSLFAGEVWMPRAALVACLLEQQAGQRGEFAPSHDLTPREVDVLRLLAVGASNGSIAERLCISPHTARTHVHRIFKKIGTSNRLEAALWAAEYL